MYMAHTNAWGSKFYLGGKTVKCQHRTIILAILVDLLSPIICAENRAQGLFSSGEELILKVFTIYGHGSHFDQWTMPILAIFHSPAQGGCAWNLSNTGPEASEKKI